MLVFPKLTFRDEILISEASVTPAGCLARSTLRGARLPWAESRGAMRELDHGGAAATALPSELIGRAELLLCPNLTNGGAAATALPSIDSVGPSCGSAVPSGAATRGGPAGPPYQVVGKFQVGGFHHRLRDGESYSQKWQYVSENPVRAGLVERAEDWPYFGRVHEIRWSGD